MGRTQGARRATRARSQPACKAFNHDADESKRCYLLAAAGNARPVRDKSLRAVYSSAVKVDGCSCSSIGSYVAGTGEQVKP